MKRFLIILPLLTVIILVNILAFPVRNYSTEIGSCTKPIITHAQTVWMYALEWCESNGVPQAINKIDRDGTSSYGSFQFKPGTFYSYGKIYGVATSTDDVMDSIIQRTIVTAMILDKKNIDWHQQFPVCVNRLGLPPSY